MWRWTVLGILTNASQTIRTNSAGEFNVPYLAYGAYNVSARKAGFKQVSRTGIALTTNQTVRVDLRLEVGAVETSVAISSSALELQTESSRVGIVPMSVSIIGFRSTRSTLRVAAI